MFLIRILTCVGMGIGLSLTSGVGESSAQGANVCERTYQVQSAIVAASGATTCAQVTLRHMQEITALDLRDQGITTLRDDDFDGLARLDSLDLSENLLASLPQDVFDELYLLKTLRLEGNLLETLPVDIFDELFLLEELTLAGNPNLVLPSGLFEDFTRFDGMQANGDPPDNSGPYPRIQRFLDRHGVTSPEQFIAALPALYKERFVMMYESDAPVHEHVSGDHPRVISFGADGQFTFSWSTNPSAPAQFRQSVEFLLQGESGWNAGIIDFSGSAPEISEPASCMSCHGSLNKPLWDKWGRWSGSEFNASGNREVQEAWRAYMDAIVDSTNPRLASLDFSASSFQRFSKNRFLFSPGRNDHLAAAEEAGALWSWRHAEVLFRLLQGRYPYFRQWAEDLVCADQDWIPLYKPTVWAFEQVDHNLFLSADNSDVTITQGGSTYGTYGVIDNVSDLIRYTYYFHAAGSIADALAFLTLVDLWETEPIVRYVYRNTPNEDTLSSNVSEVFIPAMLHFDSGTATAEDELIQKLRIHFGRGGRAALDARAKQNERVFMSGVRSASFWDGHGAVMRRLVCSAITESKPRNLRVRVREANAALSWDASRYDADSLTGYRILRGANGNSPTVHVADTGSTDTTWSDENPEPNDYVYIVKALYEGHYASPESNQARATVGPAPGPVRSLSAVWEPGEDTDAGKVTLSWTAPAGDAPVTGYRILRGEVASSLEVLIPDTGSTATTYADATVSPGESYFYKVVALNGGRAGPKSDPVDVATPEPPLKAWIEWMPERHDASTPFTFELRFSEDIRISHETLRDESFTVAGGDVTGARQVDGRHDLWEIIIEPDSREAVTVTLEGGRACGTAGAVCTREDDPRPLSNTVSATVAGPSADLPSVVSIVAVTTPIAEGEWARFKITRTGPTTEKLATAGIRWTFSDTTKVLTQPLVFPAGRSTVNPRNQKYDDEVVREDRTVTVTLQEGEGYTVSEEAGSAQVVVEDNDTAEFGLSLDAAEVTEGESTTLRVEIINGVTFEDDQTITLDVAGSMATKGADYTLSAESPTLVSGGRSVAVTVTALKDGDEEAEETVSVTASHGGEMIGTETVTITDRRLPPLTASFDRMPVEHDGESAFRFRVAFSDEIRISYKTVRDESFQVFAGEVTKARRVDGRRDLWEIAVEPLSDADVRVVLPATTDCAAAAAVCTAEGKPLSTRLEGTIPGPSR